MAATEAPWRQAFLRRGRCDRSPQLGALIFYWRLQQTMVLQEFSWDDFGKMLCTYAGWGMRIVFVPDDELEIAPKVVV